MRIQRQGDIVLAHRAFSGFEVKLLSPDPLFAIPLTVAYLTPPSMEFSWQQYGVGCHLLFQGIFLTQGSNPGFLHCRQILYHLSHQGCFGGGHKIHFEVVRTFSYS